jgi:hypothetical protein
MAKRDRSHSKKHDSLPVKLVASSANVQGRTLLELEGLNKAIGYMRVSTDRQASEGNSLQDQEDELRVFAGENRLALHALYEEVGSGMETTLEKRPELEQAVRTAKATGFPLLCTTMDRLGRNVDLLAREVLGPEIPVIVTSLGKRLTRAEFRREASAAEREGRRIGRDTRRALGLLKNLSAPGARDGGFARGEQKHNESEDHAAEIMPIISEIEGRLGRTLSNSEMARELQKLGTRAPTFESRGQVISGKWYPNQVSRVRKHACWFIVE